MSIDFWKRDYIERFCLDREGQEILNAFIAYDKENAKEFIKDKYQREVYRSDIIDAYCEKYNKETINKILIELEYTPLSEEEVEYIEQIELNDREEFE